MSADESITSLSEAVAVYGALPMPVPVGPEPLTAEREAEIREWVEAMGRKKDIRYYGSWQQHGELLGEIDRLRARVAELEAERHSTNEALDDAVQALRANTGLALPWAHEMPDGDLSGFLNDLVSAALGRWRSEPEVPDRTVLADIERVCREWRTPGEGLRSDPEPEPAPDAVTKVFVPVASLREPEGEFHGALHHDYRVGHDLPETGAKGVEPDEERLLEGDELKRAVRGHLFGGGS